MKDILVVYCTLLQVIRSCYRQLTPEEEMMEEKVFDCSAQFSLSSMIVFALDCVGCVDCGIVT